MNSTTFTSPEVIEFFFFITVLYNYSIHVLLLLSFFVVETILLQCLITCAEIRSRFLLELNSFIQFYQQNLHIVLLIYYAKLCGIFCALQNCMFFYSVYHFLCNTEKTRGGHFEI